MTVTRTPTIATIVRFDVVQRTVHWVNSLDFGILIFTGIPLYFGSFFRAYFPCH